MYQKIIDKIIELGDSLPAIAGRTPDIGERKMWFTQKDMDIEVALTELIQTFPGDHSVYAEEIHNTFIEQENVWVIDPISNTANFIYGMPHYSIVLSHLHKGEVKFAVVYDPSNKELFTAELGKGAFLNGKKISVSKNKENIFFLVSSPWEKNDKRGINLISKMSDQGGTVRILGSLGVHYAYVACGRASTAVTFNIDTFPEFAGKLLVEEAGGKFTDFNDRVLNAETRGIIASNGLVHNQIKNIISEIS